jgi:immune inhibitor A
MHSVPRLLRTRILLLLTISGLVMSMTAPAAIAVSPRGEDPSAGAQTGHIDNRTDPLSVKQADLKKAGLEAKLNGKAPGRVKEVAKGQYVELAREGEGKIWTVLGEFADYQHNSMPAPDRAVDNTTIWVDDFSPGYYKDLLFDDTPGANSMHNYYIEQSSNRYTVAGDVTDWVSLPGNACDYDDGDPGPGDAQHVWQFLIDAVNGWYASQIAAGKTPDQVNDYLAQFDIWDRYDYDEDGEFDEPDGYIDTFQAVHAGEGNEAGGGAQGDCSIWSHSWYAYPDLTGTIGPDLFKYGGIQIGDSQYWVGKYTIQPENGGVGVFAHEFGHDLGLPDLYDTSGGENGTGFWTLMSSGSWMDEGLDTIGNKPSHMGAWEKFQLGWLNYEVAAAGKTSSLKLGPMETNTRQAQGLFVVLPKKAITSNIGAPYAGSSYYYSGAGDKLNSLMYRSFNLAASSTLTAKVKYNIELDWDYAYLVYSTDNGTTWTPIQTNLSTSTNPHGQNFGQGITGVSAGWVDLTASLPAGNILLGFRYWTDSNTGGFGLMIDDIAVTGSPVDGAETVAGWTYKPATGFHVTNGTESTLFSQYYVAEYRTYMGYDSTLKTGPYFFGYLDDPDLVNFVDHFQYQDGLLISYWDTSQRNNNTRTHPGAGLLLPIDAHYAALHRVDGPIWRNRIQTYDSTFTMGPTDGIPDIHVNSEPSPVSSLPGLSVFDDRTTYYDPANPQGSVMNPNTGTQIRILSMSAQGSFMQVEVRPAK